jgi:RNA polymerase sigma factor (sigma-70 family)
MSLGAFPSHNVTHDVGDGLNWVELYPRLQALARNLVYRYRIPRWYGQERDVAEDVTQETAHRLNERLQKAVRGEMAPIASPEQLMVTIAHNYIIDLVRREQRLVRLSTDESGSALKHESSDCEEMDEQATENIYDEWLFLQLACEIARFPPKQRRAILIDLANRSCFDDQPTPLQRAFLAVGIDLQEYQLHLPEDSIERSRYNSLLSLAYRRISQLYLAQQLMSSVA